MFQVLRQYTDSFFGWLKTAYSEPDGNGSSTRLHISILTAFTVSVGISFAYLVHHKDISIEQFNTFLGAASAFLIATAGPLYAANKLSDWAKNRDNNSNPPNAPST